MIRWAAAGVSQRKLEAAAALWRAELDAEIDEELQDEAERERAQARRLGLRLAVAGGPEDEEVQHGAPTDEATRVQRAIQATMQRAKQRQLLSKQWIKFAQDVQSSTAHV